LKARDEKSVNRIVNISYDLLHLRVSVNRIVNISYDLLHLRVYSVIDIV
jgi:hypothetical protein